MFWGMSDDLLQNLLAANRDYADGGHDAMAPVTPRLRLAIVTCMDARLMPPDALGLQPGDAHIIRNAGGRVTDDVLRSLAVSCAVLGVRRIVVIPHTQCGMYKSEEEIRAAIRDVSGHDGPARLHEYGDPEAAQRTVPASRRVRLGRPLRRGDRPHHRGGRRVGRAASGHACGWR